jgi:inhibitor of KinA
MRVQYPRLLDAGETALVVEFGATVEPAISDRVLALDAALRSAVIPGIIETVPTYRSLMIHYDPLSLNREVLTTAIEGLEATPSLRREAVNIWIIPCCYDPEFGEDLAQVAEMTGLSTERLVALHSSATYRVYMYGFAPGFCYLGGLPKELAISRRPKPRPPHPPNTILVGGGLTLVSTFSMPTGWYLFGRTPERMFSLARKQTFLVEVGDMLRFEPIDRPTFGALDERAASGEIIAKHEPVR